MSDKRSIVNIVNFIRGCEPREPVTGELIYADNPTDDSATVRVGALILRMGPTGLTITTEGGELSLLIRADPQALGQPDVVVAPDRLTLCHRGFAYKVTIAAGSASRTADGIVIRAAGGKIVLRLNGQ